MEVEAMGCRLNTQVRSNLDSTAKCKTVCSVKEFYPPGLSAVNLGGFRKRSGYPPRSMQLG